MDSCIHTSCGPPRPIKLYSFSLSNTHILLNSTKYIGLEVNIDKTKYTITSRDRLNENGLLTDVGDFEKVSDFKYVGALITENNEVGKEVNPRLNLGNVCDYLVQELFIIPDSL